LVKGLVDTSRPSLIEGYAIVSADCMISDAGGTMDALKFNGDQRFFLASLDAAAAVVHSRHSAEGGLGSAHRHRLILTCQWHRTLVHDRIHHIGLGIERARLSSLAAAW
jgi:hypothetical protein